jgi:hypothetical protein
VAEPTLYLFDGFNLLHAGGFESTDALRDLLAGWVATKGARGVLVFDGHGADAMIERLAAEHRGGEQVAVVSSDEAVRGTSGAEVRKLSSRMFLSELARPEHTDRVRSDMRDRLDPETLARLERLRRGKQ